MYDGVFVQFVRLGDRWVISAVLENMYRDHTLAKSRSERPLQYICPLTLVIFFIYVFERLCFIISRIWSCCVQIRSEFRKQVCYEVASDHSSFLEVGLVGVYNYLALLLMESCCKTNGTKTQKHFSCGKNHTSQSLPLTFSKISLMTIL